MLRHLTHDEVGRIDAAVDGDVLQGMALNRVGLRGGNHKEGDEEQKGKQAGGEAHRRRGALLYDFAQEGAVGVELATETVIVSDFGDSSRRVAVDSDGIAGILAVSDDGLTQLLAQYLRDVAGKRLHLDPLSVGIESNRNIRRQLYTVRHFGVVVKGYAGFRRIREKGVDEVVGFRRQRLCLTKCDAPKANGYKKESFHRRIYLKIKHAANIRNFFQNGYLTRNFLPICKIVVSLMWLSLQSLEMVVWYFLAIFPRLSPLRMV